MDTLQITVPPVTTKVSNCLVDILEVLKSELISGDTWYHVVVKVRCPDFQSRVFCLDVKDINDLKHKVEVEIAKIRMLKFVLGNDYIREVVR